MSDAYGSLPSPDWAHERPLSIADAIGGFLDHLEILLSSPSTELPPDPVPLSTGVAEFDYVCGGGVQLGTVTLIDATLTSQTWALLCTIARRIDHRTLFVSESILDAAAWLVAGVSAVPAALVCGAALSENEWAVIAREIPALVSRPVWLSEAESCATLERQIKTRPTTVVLIDDLLRLGPPSDVALALSAIASRHAVAVIAGASQLAPMQQAGRGAAPVVTMIAEALGGRAIVVRPDPSDLLSAARLRINLLCGGVEPDLNASAFWEND